MPQTFGTNANNDIYILPSGNLAVLSGLPAVSGACATATKAQLGEMVLTILQGIPNFQTVWVGSPNLPIWESKVRQALLAVTGVIEVTSLASQVVNGQLSYQAEILSTFGPLTVNS